MSNEEKSNSIEKIENEKTPNNFTYISKNGIYLTKYMNLSKDKLIIKLILGEDKNHLYSNEFSYENLIKISYAFTTEENIEGIDRLITESINNFGVDTIEDNDDRILIIKISINSRIKDIKLNLKKTKLSDEELFSSLMEKLNNLIIERKEIYGAKSFKQTQDELNIKIRKSTEKLNDLTKKMDKIEKRFNTLKKVNLLANSHIISELKEVELIMEHLENIEYVLDDDDEDEEEDEDEEKDGKNEKEENEKVKKEKEKKKEKKKEKEKNQQKITITKDNISFKLVYRASRDGDSAEEFHKRCDDIGPNITLIITDKKVKFGGFTVKNWSEPKESETKGNSEEGKKKDKDSFCFSLTNLETFQYEEEKDRAIFCFENLGPAFSKKIFSVNDNMLTDGGCFIKEEIKNLEKDDDISGIEENFNIKDLEVFEIIII